MVPSPRMLLVTVLAALALAGCAGSPGAAPSPPPSSASSGTASVPAADPSPDAETALTVEFSAQGTEVTDTYTLECDGGDPAGSSEAPDPAAACDVLADRGTELFTPQDPNVACTQQITGMQRARVSGTVNGEAVTREFALNNGCEIGRWENLTGLLGPAEGVM